jgi:serine/threonine-protein kinase Chk1
MLSLIQETLEASGVKCKQPPDAGNAGGGAPLRLRIGGYDKRKVMFKGWIELEPFNYQGITGSFCVMQRDVVRRRRHPCQEKLYKEDNRETRFPGDNCGRV